METKLNKKNFKRVVDNYLYNIILILTAGGVILFCFYPMVTIFNSSILIDKKISFEMYRGIFSENYTLLKNTIFTSTLSASISTLIAIFLAFSIMFSKTWKGRSFYNLLLLTMTAPPFVFGLSFITLFGRRGFITYRLLGLKVDPYGWEGIVLLQIIGEVSFATFLLVESLKGLDSRLIIASRSLGATQWETIKRIIFPFSFSGIMGVFFILFTKNISDFGTAIIIGGNYSTLATEAYLTVIGEGNLGKASAMSILLIFPALIMFYFYRVNLNKSKNFYQGSKEKNNYNFSINPPYLFKGILWLCSTMFLIVILLQYGAIIISGFYNYTSRGFKFTFEYLELFALGKYETFFRSIIYSIIAGLISAFIGVLISYYTEYKKIKLMKWIEFIASLPYIIPGTFFGLGYIMAFNKKPLLLTGTVIIVVLNCIFRQLSIGSKAGNALFSKIDRNLERAAQDVGAPKWRILIDIIFPLVKPAFIAAFINGFTATMTTTGAIIFLVSPGASVATIEMFNTIRDGDYGLASIIALAIIIVTFTINLISIKFLKNSPMGE